MFVLNSFQSSFTFFNPNSIFQRFLAIDAIENLESPLATRMTTLTRDNSSPRVYFTPPTQWTVVVFKSIICCSLLRVCSKNGPSTGKMIPRLGARRKSRVFKTRFETGVPCKRKLLPVVRWESYDLVEPFRVRVRCDNHDRADG